MNDLLYLTSGYINGHSLSIGIDVERINAIRRKYGVAIPAKFDTPSKPNYTK